MLVKSFTHIDLFGTCPKWFYHRYILKEKEPETPELKEGNEVHKALEMRVGKGHMLSPKHQCYEPIAASLTAAKQGKRLVTEAALGITRDWRAVGFFDEHVWIRGKLDVILRGTSSMVQFDYKTGKPSDKTLQLEISNMLALLTYPDMQSITGMNIYLRDGSFRPQVTTTREDLPHLTHNVAAMVHEIEEAEQTGDFPPTPSGLCGWCPVKTCRFNRNKK